MQTGAVARGEQSAFALLTAPPNGPHGVNHMAGLEPMSPRDARLSGGATTQVTAFCQQAGTGGGVDGAVNAATPQKRAVGRIYNGVHGQSGDVALPDLDPLPGVHAGKSGQNLF